MSYMPLDIGIFAFPDMKDMEWQRRGECRNLGPKDLVQFFPNDGHSVTDFAKSLCQNCPVRADCLDWALKHREQGYWGGTTEKERRKMRRMRRVNA